MPVVHYGEREIPVAAGESLLDALLREGCQVPNSCRAGVCQSCLLRAEEGRVPRDAQIGLKESYRVQGYFLACRCHPQGDMRVALPRDMDTRVPAEVVARDLLAGDVLRLRLRPLQGFPYRAGQYVTLWRDATLGRSYSLASVPELDDYLEFHIKVIPSGRFSDWAWQELRVGSRLALQGPNGHCFYAPGSEGQEILLIGAGTGLAPLYGILRDALHAAHRGQIHLFHGAARASGLYLFDELRALAERKANFHYHPSVLYPDDGLLSEVDVGHLDQFALTPSPGVAGSRIYLCGDPGLVNALRKRAFLAGASMSEIYVDAFLPAAQPERAA